MWPELVEAAGFLATHGSRVKFAKVECHDEVNLCNTRKVTAFPTLILYMQNRPEQEYRGPRDALSIQKWISKVVDSSYEVVNDQNTLFKKFDGAILLTTESLGINEAYQNDPYAFEIARAGNALINKMAGSPAVFITQRAEVMPLSQTEASHTILQKISDAFYSKKIAVPNFSWGMKTKLETGTENIDYIIFFRTNKFSVGDASKAFDQAYPEFGNNVFQFVYLNVADDVLGNKYGRAFGVSADGDSAVGIISRKNKFNSKYKLNGDITTGNLKSFIEAFRSGKAERYYASAEPLSGQPRGSVRELVSKNYHDITGDSQLNVFVQFYYPWCEPCIKLEPAWNALAYRFRDAKNVVIAKVNIDENDIEGVDLTEFPTLLFYAEGTNKKQVKYTEAQTNIKSLQNFLFTQAPKLHEDIEL